MTMADIFEGNWKSFSSEEYLDMARKETRVIWNSRYHSM